MARTDRREHRLIRHTAARWRSERSDHLSTTVEEVLSRLPGFRRAGEGWVARCPSHKDSHASLSITRGDKVPVLMNCKANQGCTFESIAAALGFEKGDLTRSESSDVVRRNTTRLVAAYTYRNPDGSLFAKKERLLDDVGAKTFRWTRPDPDHDGAWLTGTKGTIPLYRLPELIAARFDEIVVIVEGEKDADRLSTLGFTVTTTPNGAGTKWRATDSEFFRDRHVCVIADDDEPGQRKAAGTAEALRGIAAAVGIVTMPNPRAMKGFDASDFLDSGGSLDELRQIIEGFETPAPIPFVADPVILEARVLQLWEDGGIPPGIYPGWPTLAKHFRPKVGQLVVVTGAPNSGKSTFLDDMIARTSFADDDDSGESSPRWNWIIFSPEQYPPERHMSHLLMKLFVKPFTEGPSTRISKPEIHSGMTLISKHVTVIEPSFDQCRLDRVIDTAAAINARTKKQAILIDPYNVIAAVSRTKGDSEHDFIGEMLTKLRAFAQANEMAVFIVAHPTKLKRESESSEYPRVRPWDISGSGHWFNHADAILSLWRAMKDDTKSAAGEVEVSISKIRFQPECGTLGAVNLFFDRVTTRFHEHPREPRKKPKKEIERVMWGDEP